MRILWTHNWPEERKSMGPFMWTLLEGLRNKGIHIDLHYVGAGYNPYKAYCVYKELKEVAKNYDLVHAQYGSLTGYITSFLNMPSIMSIRGSDWHQYIGDNIKENVHSKLACRLTFESLKNYNEIVVMSERMKEDVISYNNTCVNVIPDPIDTELFNIEDKYLSREKFFKDKSRSPWILFNTLSRNNPVKRLSFAEEVIDEVRKSIPDVQMKVASNVTYEDMPNFINACDIALCTSTHEGWPNSIKEALSCGVPFVSTDVSDLKKLESQSEYCFVSNEKDILVSNIINILKNRNCIDRNDLRLLIKDMKVEEISESLLSVYERVISK